jgi:uroporphyrinogen-III synthase
VPVYAVGNKTAEGFEGSGIEALVPEQEDGIGLAKKITSDFLNTPDLHNATVLHFCGDKRRDEFRQYLENSKINVRDVVVYNTILNNMNLPDRQYEAILFFSPSAVQAYRNSGGFAAPSSAELFAIGNTTAEELSIESGRHVHVSPVPDTEVLLQFVAYVLQNKENDDLADSQ